MSLLAALARAYDRLPDAPPYGYSSEKIGFCVVLNPDGSVASVEDLRDTDKKRSARMLMVPQAVKRTAGIAPNFLWDKTAYVLGVTAAEGKRTAEEHARFRAQHAEWLAGTEDAGLLALLRFLDNWAPELFAPPLWPEDLRDQNVVFALVSEYRDRNIHDRPAARDIWQRIRAEGASDPQICLVSGQSGPVARLHPAIKGVWGAQSSGASLVSFNLDAFSSFGHEQGDNAPVSEGAAFKYAAALNHFLADKNHRVQIGDASIVFWADCADQKTAELADTWGAAMFGGSTALSGADEAMLENQIKSKLLQIRDGKYLQEIEPALADGVRFYVAGLSPNAARISLRYWWQGSFGTLAANYASYLRDIAFDAATNRQVFSIRAACRRTAPAVLRNGQIRFDGDRASALLEGELTRAIITGTRFPRSVLGTLILRIRNDHILDRIRISLIKGLVVRDMRLGSQLPQRPDGTPDKEYLMRPDPDDPNSARRLGRLFAIIERIQLASLGDEVNATIKDKFLGAAAATPARVFPGLLLKNAEVHLKRLRNGHSDAKWVRDSSHARIVGNGLARDMGLLWASLDGLVPIQHTTEEQGVFLVGYYEERYRKRSGGPDDDQNDEHAVDDKSEE